MLTNPVEMCQKILAQSLTVLFTREFEKLARETSSRVATCQWFAPIMTEEEVPSEGKSSKDLGRLPSGKGTCKFWPNIKCPSSVKNFIFNSRELLEEGKMYSNIGKTSHKKECFLLGIARIRGGGGPCLNYLALLSQCNRP